jgi:hypothetical protein
MRHPSEEELIAYREGEAAESAATTEHLRDCAECRAEFARLDAELEAVFAAMDTLDVPDPGREFAQRVWQQIVPNLQPKGQRKLPATPQATLQPERELAKSREESVGWWQRLVSQGIFTPRRFAALAGVAALLLVAFFAGRSTKTPGVPIATNSVDMREKVLLLAVGEHLGRSEMMLTELSNTEAKKGAAQLIDISAEQKRAEDLLSENRLYRQTALEQGDGRIANVLDELERVLLDVAHSPGEVTGAQLEAIRERIDDGGILFKVRVVGEELEERQRATPADSDKLQKDRKKT